MLLAGVWGGRSLGWGTLLLVVSAAAQVPPEAPEPTTGTPPLAALVDPRPVPQLLQQGRASFYSHRFHGRRTASGERYDRRALTAAHPTLPFGTEVVVRSLRTGREVVVRITDRGPSLESRIIDLSHAAAVALGIQRHGVSEVQLFETPADRP